VLTREGQNDDRPAAGPRMDVLQAPGVRPCTWLPSRWTVDLPTESVKAAPPILLGRGGGPQKDNIGDQRRRDRGPVQEPSTQASPRRSPWVRIAGEARRAYDVVCPVPEMWRRIGSSETTSSPTYDLLRILPLVNRPVSARSVL
jgi:hypothetical protein